MLHNISRKDTRLLYATKIIQQTAFWSAVKQNMGLSSFAVELSPGRTVPAPVIANALYDMLIIIRQIDRNSSIAYVPYGPEVEPEEEYQGRFLEELSELLRPFLPKHCIAIRYELCWQSYWAKDKDCYDDTGNWTGEPEQYAREFRFNFQTVYKNFRQANGNSLPSSTVFIDLRDDYPTILRRMKPKTRYNIGLALRKGITVQRAGMESLEIWNRLYAESAMRNGFLVHDPKHFKAVLQTRADDTLSPVDIYLLIARMDNKPLAAMFLAISDIRGVYLYGASSSSHRNMMAPYALQWEAIRICKERHCLKYDMFGIAPAAIPSHPLYGLYKFKTGFGGQPFHRMGSWDYPIDQEKYRFFRSRELSAQGFHV